MKVTTSLYRHPHLPEILGWKMNHKPGIRTTASQLTGWPDGDPVPDDATLERWAAEWEALPIEERDARYKLKAEIDGATTIAQLKAILRKVTHVSNLP